MPRTPARPTAKDDAVAARLRAALAWLERHASPQRRDEMGPRYGIHTDNALGVAMADVGKLAKTLGRDHALAHALWETGVYDARLLASMVDDPALVTAAQMDRWCRDFDNWGICDTVCFKLFDQTPHAVRKVAQWAKRDEEFIRRGAFALLACLALHRRDIDDDVFMHGLVLIETAAGDERNFVRKGVNWALRAIGQRRSPATRAAAIASARRLAASSDASARWNGRDALRKLAPSSGREKVVRRAR